MSRFSYVSRFRRAQYLDSSGGESVSPDCVPPGDLAPVPGRDRTPPRNDSIQAVGLWATGLTATTTADCRVTNRESQEGGIAERLLHRIAEEIRYHLKLSTYE
jgi:hypothetical protein